MAKFKAGDRVEVLDEAISGIVDAVMGDQVTLITDEGFPMRYNAAELVKIEGRIAVSNHEVAKVKGEKELPKRRKTIAVKPKERSAPKMEVDLHIHQLVKSTRGMTKFDMLNVQMDTARRQLEFAIDKRIQKVVFIHGVGEGVLKEELHYLFGRYDNVKYYDADYQKYGLGATEVYIYQNP
ncbi:Smr/MutS family protein [Flagellimonas zhangzhouensis]|uniref:Smr domain-containing protein n=1 Tax=Flagellimonas zhangzhouensis TaxID=1073328 RepID=A0A1H2R226_9FLAO|nr:Smr/MutS family protein [Allomuricauda zhangzhouensis]SDQ58933.1 Smr domain-containing protein [Allomuricauda zhangzhouensis]SDW13431.1 Smr domain-containing protein [Allomuricauda zhangzhouensis]